MKKEYTRPKMIVTSYEAKSLIMLSSVTNLKSDNFTTKKYSDIIF